MKKEFSVDIIKEATPGAGVTVGGVLLQDGAVTGTDNAYVAHSLATAANDFIVASGSGVFVKKTLAQTKAILYASLSVLPFSISASITLFSILPIQ